jgi:hypothetical protein
VYIPVKIATYYDTNLPPEKLKAATQNEQNDGWLIVKNRPKPVFCNSYWIDLSLLHGRLLIG